jgi:hypothetical protein
MVDHEYSSDYRFGSDKPFKHAESANKINRSKSCHTQSLHAVNFHVDVYDLNMAKQQGKALKATTPQMKKTASLAEQVRWLRIKLVLLQAAWSLKREQGITPVRALLSKGPRPLPH